MDQACELGDGPWCGRKAKDGRQNEERDSRIPYPEQGIQDSRPSQIPSFIDHFHVGVILVVVVIGTDQFA